MNSSTWVLFLTLITADGGITSNTMFFLDSLTCEHVKNTIVSQVEALRKPRVSYIAMCIQNTGTSR